MNVAAKGPYKLLTKKEKLVLLWYLMKDQEQENDSLCCIFRCPYPVKTPPLFEVRPRMLI